jgi:Rrf2 family protein
MKLSRAAAWAVHALVYLARQPPGRSAPASQIARALGTSFPVVQTYLRRLARAGLVLPKAGLHGGYALARPAGDIPLLDVIEAVGKPVRLELQLPGGGPKAEGFRRRLGAVFARATEEARQQLVRVSVADLAGPTT